MRERSMSWGSLFSFKDFLLECHCLLVPAEHQITNRIKVWTLENIEPGTFNAYAIHENKIKHSWKTN